MVHEEEEISRRTILVVEDDEGLNRLIRKTLEKEGFLTESAATGTEALRYAGDPREMIVLIDYLLPDMTGMQVIDAWIAADRPLSFVVMTGHGDEKIAVEMMKRGARDYITKSANMIEILPQIMGKICLELDHEKKLHAAEEELRIYREHLEELVRARTRELQEANAQLHTEITERKQTEEALRFLVHCGTSALGEDFFLALARYLAQSLGMEYVCIDRLQGDLLEARTVAVWFDDKFEDNVSYALKDTPCGDVVEKKVCCFPRGVRHLFPKDVVLQEMSAESYVGTILWGSQGQPIGLIAIIGRQPLANPQLVTSILQLAAIRAAGEMERRQAEGELRKAKDELELRVRERTTELEKANTELQRSNKDLEQFAYVSSHDLQEPLRMVTSFMQLLEKEYRDRIDETGRQYIGFAAEGARRMQLLIKNLLEYSRVNTRGKPYGPVNCDKIFNQVIRNLKLVISETQAQVTCDSLPTVWGDESQIMQVFQNLIENAIKFRKHQELPLVHVSARPNGREWVFSVRDNGIGIDPQHHDRIFTIFQRLHSRDEYPGTGIGLTIVKRIVERHGGQVCIESNPGKGSTFIFTVPGAGGYVS